VIECLICCHDDIHDEQYERSISLPFTPVAGMTLTEIARIQDDFKIESVNWNDYTQVLELFVQSAPAEHLGEEFGWKKL